MHIIGIDFTSRPERRKPITALHGRLADGVLTAQRVALWSDFAAFEAALAAPGPWVAGMDFPFGQSRRFIETIGWPTVWTAYVRYAGSLGRAGFRAALDDYRAGRAAGDKEHRRAMDQISGAISPQKLYGVPVGLMFFEGAPRLAAAGVTIPGLQAGDPARTVFEAYPGVLARALIGRDSYKNDDRKRQTPALRAARQRLLAALVANCCDRHGFAVALNGGMTAAMIDDATGDRLDALLCAVQAAWAWGQLSRRGLPQGLDPLEGWIADPLLVGW